MWIFFGNNFIYTHCCKYLLPPPGVSMKPANARKRQWIRAEGYINAHRNIWMYRGRHRNLAPHELQPRSHRCRPLKTDPCQQLHVCVSSQVRTKLQMVDAEALRSLTPPTPPHLTPPPNLSLCSEIIPVACFLLFSLQNCFGGNPGALGSAAGKLIKQQVNVNKAKETWSSCHWCGREKIEETSLV